MTNINISNFRENLYQYVKNTIRHNEIININTKDGNAVVLSEEDYNGLIETLYLNGSKKTIEDIQEAENTPQEERISLSEVEW